jgi:hypothetical protein
MRRSLHVLLLIAFATLLGGCTGAELQRLSAGTPAADVRLRAGAPSEVRPLPDGMKAWYYENGPLGWTTWRTRFDAQDRLIDVEQMLTEPNFRKLLVAERSRREDVLDTFGRPGLISRFPNLGEEVWTYRYQDVTLEMLNDDHFDLRTGVLRYYTLYRDPAYVSAGHK